MDSAPCWVYVTQQHRTVCFLFFLTKPWQTFLTYHQRFEATAAGGMSGLCACVCVCAAYLWRGVRARVLPLVQLVPALHQLDDHGVAEVDQLEARDVGAAVHEALQVDVLKTLQ